MAEKTLVRLGDLESGSGEMPGLSLKPSKKLDNTLGQWNYLELRVSGGKATVWLNGTVVADGVDLQSDGEAAAGIALHADGPGLEFRNFRIKEIKE
jgi:hypothetical protein